MGLWIFLSFGVVSLFSFIAVATWVATREQERKAFYRGEMLKKLAESGSAAVIEYLREEERLEAARQVVQRDRVIEGNRLGGLILLAVGITLTVALRGLVPLEPVYLLGFAPVGIGLVLLAMPLLNRK